MKTLRSLLVIFFFAFTAAKASAQTGQRFHIQPDKVKHFGVGALVAGGAQTIAYQLTDSRGKAMLIGFGTGVVAGAVKEFYDMGGHGTPSFKDALWTAVGAGVASVSLRYTLEAKPRHAQGL